MKNRRRKGSATLSQEATGSADQFPLHRMEEEEEEGEELGVLYLVLRETSEKDMLWLHQPAQNQTMPLHLR